jgi:iron complex transport system substrate-binding protein
MRVVSLLPAATDILCALGASEMIVGATHECDAPGLAATVPRVTTSAIDANASPAAIDGSVRVLNSSGTPLFRLDEEQIRAARPDLIITQSLCDVCAVNEDDVRALAARLTPSPRIVTLGATTLDGVLDEVALISETIDRADEGVELALGLRARMRTVHLTLKAAAAPRPRVAVIEWTEPLYAAGHWVPDMVKRAGGADVLALTGSHSATRTMEAVRDAAPDLIVVAPCGYGLERAACEGRTMLARADWAWARDRTVWAVDANTMISRPGPRLVEGIETLARIFNPTLFSPLVAGRGVRLL